MEKEELSNVTEPLLYDPSLAEVPDDIAKCFPSVRHVGKLSGYKKANGFREGNDSLKVIAKEFDWNGTDRAVGVSICVYSFGPFDLTAGTFFCDFGIKVVWRLGTFESNSTGTRKAPAFDEQGNKVDVAEPLVDIMNCCSALNEVQKRPHSIVGDLVNSFTRVQTTLKVIYNLKWYPFDSEALSIQVRLLDNGMVITPLRYHELKAVCLQPEWFVYKPVRCYTQAQGATKPTLIFSILVRRKWEANWFGVVCLQGSVTSLSFTGYAMSPQDFGSRSSVALTLILTSVAFKLYTFQRMPEVPYLTMLDLYTLGAFVLQILIFASQGFPMLFIGSSHIHSIVPGEHFFGELDEEVHEMLDNYSFWILIAVWVVFNAAWHIAAAVHITTLKFLFKDGPVFE